MKCYTSFKPLLIIKEKPETTLFLLVLTREILWPEVMPFTSIVVIYLLLDYIEMYLA